MLTARQPSNDGRRDARDVAAANGRGTATVEDGRACHSVCREGCTQKKKQVPSH